MRYFLDTCTFLWLVQQPSMLSATAATAINDQSAELLVSDVSVWEITLKHAAGKLPLPDSPRRWIPKKFAYHQLKSLQLEVDAIFRSGELPRVHSDPFDRLLAAQAVESGLVLISPDEPLSALGAARIW